MSYSMQSSPIGRQVPWKYAQSFAATAVIKSTCPDGIPSYWVVLSWTGQMETLRSGLLKQMSSEVSTDVAARGTDAAVRVGGIAISSVNVIVSVAVSISSTQSSPSHQMSSHPSTSKAHSSSVSVNLWSSTVGSSSLNSRVSGQINPKTLVHSLSLFFRLPFDFYVAEILARYRLFSVVG